MDEVSAAKKVKLPVQIHESGEQGSTNSHSSLSSLPRGITHDIIFSLSLKKYRGFPGGAVVENLPASAGDTGSSPGLGRSHMPRSNWAREPFIFWRIKPLLSD